MKKSKLHFQLSFTEPQAHYVEVSLFIIGFEGEFLDLRMPVWTPGSYLIREFSKNVELVKAKTKSNHPLKIIKTNKNTWQLENSLEEIIVSYRVYSFEKSVRTNFIDQSHAFISPAGTFFFLDGELNHPVSIEVVLPEFWSKISTGLGVERSNDRHFFAENFDILFDSPIEIGNHDTWVFQAAGIPHEFAMVGTADYDKERLTQDITKIIEVETQLWGSNPNSNYVFITHNYQNAHGGLEHLNSTVLAASRLSYFNSQSYLNYLTLVAHEYFHLWNVKRLRPASLGPFNYNQENYTCLLWIFEGFTSYYDNLIIRRCGFRNETEYLNELVSEFNIVLNRAGHLIQSVGLSSFDTWIKQYRPDENSPNVSISYYNKGAMLACMMDIWIIASSAGKMRLDDVMRAAYQQFFLNQDKGITETEFQQLAESITGISLQKIFDAVYSTEELDYNAFFNLVGYQFIDQNKDTQTASLGIKVSHQEGKTLIKQVERNSAAWNDGLNVDDELLAINGNRIDPQGREMEQVIQLSTIGDQVDILIARDGLINQIPVTLKASDKVSYSIERNPNSSELERKLGDIWLSL